MVAYPPSTRVERQDMQTLRQRMDFAQILPLVMWIPTKLFAVGVHKFRKKRQRVEQLALRLFIYGTKGARAGITNLVLQKFSTCKEEHGAKGNAVRVHRWFIREKRFHFLLQPSQTYSDIYSGYPWVHSNLTTFHCDCTTTDTDYPRTRDVTRHEKPLRAGYIKRNLTDGFLPGVQDRHSLFSKTVFRRF